MSEDHYKYRDRTITIRVFEDPQGHWNWIYKVGCTGLHSASHQLSDRATAIVEAKKAAEEKVDELIKGGT